jgi:peptide deformylase
MAILKILTAPDPRLKRISEPVIKVDNEIQKLFHDMVETLYNADNGVGLAAPQVGVLKRVIILDNSKYDNVTRPKGFWPLFMANPEIIEASDSRPSEEEACFSVPTFGIEIPRADKIKVQYLDINNNTQILEAEDFFARLIQHEMDHLNGVLTLDYLTPIKRDIAVRKLTKIKKYNS